jgi:hypothetical protein
MPSRYSRRRRRRAQPEPNRFTISQQVVDTRTGATILIKRESEDGATWSPPLEDYQVPRRWDRHTPMVDADGPGPRPTRQADDPAFDW